MTEEQLLDIIEQGENRTVEFKTSFSDDVIISLVAFSNTKGSGRYVDGDTRQLRYICGECNSISPRWQTEIF